MWLSNTSTTAMVMPIAEAVLQQLICTGLADGHNDSETAEAPEDDSGTSAAAKQTLIEMFAEAAWMDNGRKNSSHKNAMCVQKIESQK